VKWLRTCFFNGICRSHVDSLTRGEYNLVWIFFTSQSRLIIIPKIMLNLEIVCDTLNRIFGVVEVIVFPAYITWQIIRTISLFEKLAKYAKLYWTWKIFLENNFSIFRQLTPKGSRVYFSKKAPNLPFLAQEAQMNFIHFFALLTKGSCPRLLGEHVQKVSRQLTAWIMRL
jgi:hypothetical protein